ncbi:hypothetical protein OXX80_014353, partial [Metschnikowia pulcherrima]
PLFSLNFTAISDT